MDVDETLRMCGTRPREAMKAYESVVRSVGREAWATEEPGGLPWRRRVEADDELAAPAPGAPSLDALGASTSAPRIPVDLDAVLAAVAVVTGVGENRLTSEARDRVIVRARELVALLAVQRCWLAVNLVGRRWGKTPDTASRWLTRGTMRCVEDQEFRPTLEELDDHLRGA
jgi:hypothetical protein